MRRPGPKPFVIPKHWIECWKAERWTIAELAGHMGVSSTKVWNALQRLGLHPVARRGRPRIVISQYWIDRWKAEGWTLSELAGHLHVSVSTASNALGRLGLLPVARRSRRPFVMPQHWIDRWKAEGWSVTELAQRMRAPIARVQRALQRLGESNVYLGHTPLRDREIFRAFQEGASCRRLGEQYGLTYQRIMQIVHWQANTRGTTIRPSQAFRKSKKCFTIPEHVIPLYLNGHPVGQLARDCNISVKYFKVACHRAGLPTSRDLQRIFVQRLWAEVYAKFMGGMLVRDLAQEYETSKGNIEQMILKHRRLTNAPGKR